MQEQEIEKDAFPASHAITKKVMIISPMPGRVKELLVALTETCFDVFTLHECSEDFIHTIKPELVIYDALPTVVAPTTSYVLESGQQLLKAVTAYNVPLLLLTEEKDFELSEYEYLSDVAVIGWPSSDEEILSRIYQLLDKVTSGVAHDDLIVFKEIVVDLKRMIVTKEKNRIDLTKTEYDLLLYFLTSDGSVQTREVLLHKIWGLECDASSNVVDVHIKSLRKKLDDSAVDSNYIVTVRGTGYRLAD